MNTEELISALRRNMVETGSLICLGCGHEHNCGIHGCAIMRAAADRIEQIKKVSDNLAEKLNPGDTLTRDLVIQLLEAQDGGH